MTGRTNPRADSEGSAAHPDLQMLTDVELARAAKCTPAALRRMRREGRGPAYVKLGRLVRYRLSAVQAWLGAHTVKPE